METFWVSCKIYTVNKNSSARKTKQNKLMLLPNCAICGIKRLTLLRIKKSTILITFEMISLTWKKSLTNFYWLQTNLCQNCIWNSQDLLTVLVDQLLGIVKELKNCNLKHLYRNELGKACFAHDATYSDSKDLAKKTISNKILKDRAYEIWWISKSISKYGLLVFLIRKQDWEWM